MAPTPFGYARLLRSVTAVRWRLAVVVAMPDASSSMPPGWRVHSACADSHGDADSMRGAVAIWPLQIQARPVRALLGHTEIGFGM